MVVVVVGSRNGVEENATVVSWNFRSPHSFATPVKFYAGNLTNGRWASTPTHSSKHTSSISGVGVPSQLRKKRCAPEPTRSVKCGCKFCTWLI
ncbi:hypothetical protein ACFX1R_048389 [Malus domestica]